MSEEDLKVNTVGYNPRFPNQNQTKHCWSAFVEYNKCIKENPESPVCPKFYQAYKSLCPDEWVQKWKTQVENGTFPGQEAWTPELRKKH
eukprot:TRINITY_DN2502_c0_g1_i1.p1 TRINITY_DN2502_c0_g1~~TRINITY_DN2502_c0_g1_i1.p1  ORF type:complete len:89 (+),score=34.48 TRINITY_DN2502_c0_g1_i1:42-308(+)